MKNKILVIDNYDSFVYNLVQILVDLDCELDVRRNDKIELSEVSGYSRILLSPGPGIPSEAGKMMEIIQTFKEKIPILGVCLGHQAIAEVFGGKLRNLSKVYHGVSEQVNILDVTDYIFKGLPKEFMVGRYHSWCVENKLPDELEVTAMDNNNIVMALKHKEYDIRGLQFHPESVLTQYGKELISNWVRVESF